MIYEDNSLPIIALKSTLGNPEVTFTSMQMWIFAHITYFEYFWWAVWVVTLFVLIWKAFIKKEFSSTPGVD